MLLLIAQELRIQTKEQKFNCYSVGAFVAVLHFGSGVEFEIHPRAYITLHKL